VAGSLSPEVVARLISAAFACFNAAWGAVVAVDPTYADVDDARRLQAMQLVWVTVLGLAEHFTGIRAFLYDSRQRELTALAAKTVVAGLNAVLIDTAAR
jgi:hypothetical protein